MVKFYPLYTILLISIIWGCSTTSRVKDGQTAYSQKQYAKAITMLESEIAETNDPALYASLSYMLGDSYKNINDSENSLKWFIEAAKNNYGPEAFWEMAYALKKKERYEDAILSFRRLEQMTSRTDEIRKEIEKCRQARIWTDEKGDHPYILEALSLNSPQSDYAPFILNERSIVFTSDRISDIEGDTYHWTGNSFSDLFIAEIDDFSASPFDPSINTIHNEGTACFNRQGNEMFYTRCFSETGDSYCRILRSVKVGSSWSVGEEVFSMKRNVNYGDPVLIEDDNVLIFTSDDPTGIGGRDLYYSVREDDGSWSDPELMPPYLNSIGNERFPTWHDGTLYYSSDHFAGLGGLDIFKTVLREDGSWTQPENLKAPINSSEDDYSYVVQPVGHYPAGVKLRAFFTSTRGIFGSDDIYLLTELIPEDELAEPVDSISADPLVETEQPRNYFLRVSVFEKIYAIPGDPNSYVVGSRPVPSASVKMVTRYGEELFQTKDDGDILLPLDTTTDYSILVGKEGYLNDRRDFTMEEAGLKNKEDGTVFEVKMEIERLYENIEIVLEDIYYEFDKWDIQESAKPSLNYLINLLNENPAINIQLASHTDCRGEDDYNEDLSRKRAASALDYIVNEGNIDPARLSSVGYGEYRPEIDCICEECSEDEHQVNRRTTFTIVGNQ